MSLPSFFTRRRTFLTTVSAAVLAVALAACGKSEASLQDIHGIDLSEASFGDGFQLKDPDGNVRSLADFQGKVVMMFFGFTQCPDVCPTALVKAAEVKSLLGEDGDKPQVLFITVDPERDTPDVLREYAQAFDPSFIGLYGSAEETAAVAKAYRVYYAKVPTGSSYTMEHTALTYVFDRNGTLRVALRHEQSAEESAEDIRKVMALG
ncbi:MAG: SCO family protein [Burkholderiaceae bacterium]